MAAAAAIAATAIVRAPACVLAVMFALVALCVLAVCVCILSLMLRARFGALDLVVPALVLAAVPMRTITGAACSVILTHGGCRRQVQLATNITIIVI